MIFGSIFVPIGLLCVIHTLPYSNSLTAMYQLLWMVCTSANPLDRSYNRNGDIWLRIHDNLVSSFPREKCAEMCLDYATIAVSLSSFIS